MTRALQRAYAHGPGKVVDVSGDLGVAGRTSSPPGRSVGGAVGEVLAAALAPRTFLPWAQHNPHRAYPSARAAHAHDAAVTADGEGGATVTLRPDPERLPAGYGQVRDALALLEVGHVTGALAEAAAAHGVRATTEVRPGAVDVTLTAGFRPSEQWAARSRAGRSSGLGPRGLAADPRPMPGQLLSEFATAALRTPGGTVPGTELLRHRIAVHDVAGRPDGVYVTGPTGLRMLRPGGVTDALQAAFTIGPGEVDVAGMNVGWVITADLVAAVAAGGPDAYERVLVATGAAAQHVCSAAAAAGLFCRPVRSVDEASVEAAVAAPPGDDFLYLLLVGRPVVADFEYDLAAPDPAALARRYR